MQDDYKRLACAFDKSFVANFSSHEVETKENTHDSSVENWHDQSQPLYGMPMNTSPEQLHPTQIGGKSTPGPPYSMQTQIDAYEPSTYMTEQFEYTAGQPARYVGQSDGEYVERDANFHHPSLHPSQPSFPLLPMAPQHHSIFP
jgi:hypothetical protein